MKFKDIVDRLTTTEKTPFVKIIENINKSAPAKKVKQAEKIMASSALKDADGEVFKDLFLLYQSEFAAHLKDELSKANNQFDIVIDILCRDGNSILSRDWFNKQYLKEFKSLKKRVSAFNREIQKEDCSLDRVRDFKLYRSCLEVAYNNDLLIGREPKISMEELTILLELSKGLHLSLEEVKLINYSILPLEEKSIDDIINMLKNLGVLFYSKKSMICYVPDEMIMLVREIRGRRVADKFFRRVMKQLKDPQINLVCKSHGIDRKLSREEKIEEIILSGVSFHEFLSIDIHKPGLTLTQKKAFVNDLVNKGLELSSLKGSTMDEKIENLIEYFAAIEQDPKIGISMDGYQRLLHDLSKGYSKLNKLICQYYSFEKIEQLDAEELYDHNIKPRDILEIVEQTRLAKFIEQNGVKKRGNDILNILEAYKDTESLYLENYAAIAERDLITLKSNDILVKESEMGLLFERLTSRVFSDLGLVVDEDLKKELSTPKHIIDIVLNIGDRKIIIVECKTAKSKKFSKFSSVSRQIKSYGDNARKGGYDVLSCLLVAPNFTEDFIRDAGIEADINLSLICADGLKKIRDTFKEGSKYESLPYNLLRKDVVINEDRVIKAIKK